MVKRIRNLACLLVLGALAACSQTGDGSADEVTMTTADDSRAVNDETPEDASATGSDETAKTERATFGAGCFWCVEAVLEQLDGVLDVQSGYMGGTTKNPTYREICTGRTGHAEVVQVSFVPAKVSYETLLGWFWKLHDPTTLNRQGADTGTQYRSAIFWHSEEQRGVAEKSKKAADDADAFDNPIVTEITQASTFYVAEADHQDFYRANKFYPYCQAVITPKLHQLGLEK